MAIPALRSIVRSCRPCVGSALLLMVVFWPSLLAESPPEESSPWSLAHLTIAEDPQAAPLPPVYAQGDGSGAAGRDCGAPWRNLRDMRLWNILLDLCRLPGTGSFWAVGHSHFGPDGIAPPGQRDPLICRTRNGTTGWEVMQPDLSSDALSGEDVSLQTVRFMNPDEGCAAGWAQGTEGTTAVIYRSEDGGVTWSLVYESPVGPHYPFHIVVDLEFADELHGWAVGSIDIASKIALVRTGDGGRTWTTRSVGVDAAITEIDFLDRDVGFAVGNLGYTLRTSDGGDTWEVVSQTPGLGRGLLGLDFLDAQRGFGANGRIIRTDDGGVSWRTVEGGGGDLWDLRFADALNGWAAGGPALGAYTQDGGETWHSWVHVARGGELRACVPIDGDSVFVVGAWGTIRYTNDAGFSWQDIEGEGYVSSAVNGFADLVFVDEDTGWVVGEGQIIHTRDGGRSWVQQGEPGWGTYGAVEAVDRRLAWVARSRDLWRTTDGGDHWAIVADVETGISDLCFIDEETGWACGAGGSILRSDDGGLKWRAQVSGSTEHLHAMDFLNERLGWAAGGRGTIVHTADGGESWRLQHTGSSLADSLDLYAVSAVDEKRIFAVNRSHVLATVDGGEFWAARVSGDRPLFGVHFADRNVGCMVGGIGEFGYAGCTEQGGRNWRDCSVPDETSGILRLGRKLGLVFVASPDVRYAAGERGVVLKFEHPDRPRPRFLRGDCNGDGRVEISDAITALGLLFFARGDPACADACDANDDGGVDISDAVATLGVLFLGEGEMPPPGTIDCGIDPTQDPLDCKTPAPLESCPTRRKRPRRTR